MNAPTEPVRIRVDESHDVDGLWTHAPRALACFVLAHGAGAGMTHPSMASVATGLSELGISSLRYQFPYMQRGSKRPDPPPLCHATVRAAVALARECMPAMPLVAGGRSFGGRMTSQAQATEPLAGVAGLVFLAFPLHPAGEPSDTRAQHLERIRIPMLFVQGTRDELANLELLHRVIDRLGSHATLKLLADADHSFHVLARSGRKDADVKHEAFTAIADWVKALQ